MKVNYLQIKHLLTTTLAILLLSSSTANCMSKRETPEAKERGGATYRIINANEHGTTINPKDVEIFNKYKDTKDMHQRTQARVEKILSDRELIKGSPVKQQPLVAKPKEGGAGFIFPISPPTVQKTPSKQSVTVQQTVIQPVPAKQTPSIVTEKTPSNITDFGKKTKKTCIILITNEQYAKTLLENIKKILNLDTKFEIDEFEFEISDLKKQDEIANKILTNNKQYDLLLYIPYSGGIRCITPKLIRKIHEKAKNRFVIKALSSVSRDFDKIFTRNVDENKKENTKSFTVEQLPDFLISLDALDQKNTENIDSIKVLSENLDKILSEK